MLNLIRPQPQTTGSDRSKEFPSPWLDYTSQALPENHSVVLWWAQFLWLTDGNFRGAMERVAAHFMTEIEFPDLEPDEESTWREYFTHFQNYRRDLISCAYDFLAYGNSFVSLYLPFRRMSVCPDCHSEESIDRTSFKLEMMTHSPYLRWHRTKPCRKCGSTKDFQIADRRDPDLARVVLNRYDPQDMDLAENPFSHKKRASWRIPADIVQDINSGARIHIEDTPIEILEAVARRGKFTFNPDLILHQGEVNISGIHNRGWGVPRSISNFRTAWLQQLTNKLDQATAIDYTLGLRLISPAPTAGGNDPMITSGMENFTARVQEIISTHRRNPTSYNVVPHAFQYQFLGGEGATLVPPEKLKFRQQEFLSQLGVPLEYHQMTLQTQAAPMAIRLFEAYWNQIPAFYNRILDWQVKLLSRVYGLKPTTVRLQRTTIADDLERRQVLLQLMAGNQLSPQTALQPFGVDSYAEAKKVMRHQAHVTRLQREFDEEQAQEEEMGVLRQQTSNPTPSMMGQPGAMDPAAAQAGAMGGAPMGGMPGPQQTPTSISGLADQAQQVAGRLYTLDDYTRKQELKYLREGNRELHALVMQALDELRRSAASQGGQMLQQQAAAGGGPPMG